MKILLFGVSNVGKTTIGKLLAEKIKFSFYDLDDEIKKYYGITLEEFVHTENLRWRDQKRGQIINKILKLDENMVLAITPISYPDNFEKCIVADDILLMNSVILRKTFFHDLYLVMKKIIYILTCNIRMNIKNII